MAAQQQGTAIERLLDAVEAHVPEAVRPRWTAARAQYGPTLVALERRFLQTPWAHRLQEATGIPAPYVSLAAALASILAFRYAFRNAASFVTNVVGFLYPAYQSLKALETETTADDRQWLTYWTVYAAFNCAEYFSDRILSFLPFYFGIKLAFLVWSFHPSTRGAELVHARLLRPLLLRYGPAVDRKAANMANRSYEIARDAADRTYQLAQDTANAPPKLD